MVFISFSSVAHGSDTKRWHYNIVRPSFKMTQKHGSYIFYNFLTAFSLASRAPKMSKNLRLGRKIAFQNTLYTKCIKIIIDGIGHSIILRSIYLDDIGLLLCNMTKDTVRSWVLWYNGVYLNQYFVMMVWFIN